MALPAILRGAPWQIVLFSLGMYLVVYGLGNAWLTAAATGVLEWLAAQGTFVAGVGTGFAVAALASVMNNMPATLVGALAIDGADVPAATRELMLYANVVGNDLGPKLTPIGSLATLLWLHVLAGKGQGGAGFQLQVGIEGRGEHRHRGFQAEAAAGDQADAHAECVPDRQAGRRVMAVAGLAVFQFLR